MKNMKVQIILGSTRQNRFGETVAKWVYGEVKKNKEIDVELVDLLDYPLPFYDEVAPPMALQGNYKNPGALKWVKKVSEADAYIIVTAEYNHGYPAALKNALDYPYLEWNNKPVGFVSYGGPGGGYRAVEQLRQVAGELQMHDIRENVGILNFYTAFNEDGQPKDESYNKRLGVLVEQLLWWARALKYAREEVMESVPAY